MSEEIEYYEPRFWGLDPVFSARVKLNIADVMALQPHPTVPEVYCISNHPVLSVHIMGDVVSIQKKSKMAKYEVDDGSGVISCTHWYLEQDSEEGLFIPTLGQLVSVWGKLSEYRNEKQLTVTTIVEHADPNVEPLHWLEVAQLKATIYRRPFSLPPGVLANIRSEESLKESARKSVLEFLDGSLSSGRKQFTLAQLCNDAEMQKLCLERMRGGKGVGSGMEQQHAISSAIQELPESGMVIPAVGAGRHKETIYEVFFTKQHLCPLILDYIKRKEATTESVSKLGVPEGWIVKFVQQKETFSKLPTTAVLEAIELLVEDSAVYSFGTKSYKTVT